MTRHNDLEEPMMYHQIKFVEFLDFISRVAIDYFAQVKTSTGPNPKDLEDKVYEIVKILWATKAPAKVKKGAAKKPEVGAKGRRVKKVPQFPELQAPFFEDSDDY